MSNKEVQLIWSRVISSFTHRELDKVKKRWKLANKRYFIEFYQPGEIVNNIIYKERLMKFIKDNYNINRKTVIFGATDGAPSLKKIIKSLPNNVLIAYKFHVKRNYFDKWYLRNNREEIRNWKHPDCLGYSAESDIAKLKRKLGFGNRIYNLDNLKTLLKLDNLVVT